MLVKVPIAIKISRCSVMDSVEALRLFYYKQTKDFIKARNLNSLHYSMDSDGNVLKWDLQECRKPNKEDLQELMQPTNKNFLEYAELMTEYYRSLIEWDDDEYASISKQLIKYINEQRKFQSERELIADLIDARCEDYKKAVFNGLAKRHTRK